MAAGARCRRRAAWTHVQGGEEGEPQQRPREALAQGHHEGSPLPEELLRGVAQVPVQPAVPLRHIGRLPRRLQEPLHLRGTAPEG